jgi:folate-binding protein YgfZ
MRNLQNQRASEELLEGYAALGTGVGLVDHGHRVLLGLSGRDPSGPAGLLAAILTNEIPARDDLGVYGLLLDAKGHVQTDLRILKRPGGDLVAVAEKEGANAAREILGRYAPFSRVTVEELSETADEPWGMLGVYGPRASEKVSELFGETLDLAEHQTAEITPPGSETPVLISGVFRPVAGYDLTGPSSTLLIARESLIQAGAVSASEESYEAARIEEGVPRFGSELTPENFPGEAGILDRAVSFAKGCYPGQETVARMHYRGHPNRALYRLSIEGTPPEPGTPILQEGKEVGRLTSLSPLGDSTECDALGYLHRKADIASHLEAGGVGIRVHDIE